MPTAILISVLQDYPCDKKKVVIYAFLSYISVEPTQKKQDFRKYLAHWAMIMSYISDRTGATADIGSYILSTLPTAVQEK